LNIPDTSERDSLFQAESRRCKEIIDVILDKPADKGYRHFCIFDELYSGTNPTEATKSAYAFLSYLTKFSNVDFVLTTHYVSVCKKLKKSNRVQNYKMMVDAGKDGTMIYTYKIKKGISKVQGAIKILESLEYPDEIIQSVKRQ
jgi:DNA mismatch repair ATPase MutS